MDSYKDRLRPITRRNGPDIVIVATIFVLAIVGVLGFRLLSGSLAFDRKALAVQALNAVALKLALDEETGIRGYAVTGRRVFLQPYDEAAPRLDGTLATLASSSAALGVASGQETVTAMQRVHERWRSTYADPLLGGHLARDDAYDVELRGKRLIDQYRLYDKDLSDALDARIERRAAESEAQFFLLALVGGTAVCAGFVGLVLAGRQQARTALALERQTDIVQTLQRAFTSRRESLPHTDVGSAYLSASTEAQVGGDFLDVRRLDERRGYVIIADVSGKGVGAAVDTALIRFSVNALAQHSKDDPGAVLAGLNKIFLDTRDDEASFVVAFLGIFNFGTFSFRYASAGHSPAFIRRDQRVEQLAVTGPVVGLYPSDRFETRTLLLRAGDTIVLATDGLTEARSAARDAFLSDEGAMQWIADATDGASQELVDSILDKLRAYTDDRIEDDLAILAMKVVGTPAADTAEMLAELERAG